MRRRKIFFQEIKKALQYKSPPRQVLELINHKLKINTNFRDYYRFGFYKSDESWEHKSRYLGPNGSRYWPFEGNSLKYDRLFAVKSIQKSLLQGAGLPTPVMLFKVGSEYPIDTLEKFRDALSEVRIPVLAKFDGGGGGEDIYALEPSDRGLICAGNPVDAEWLWSKYADRLDRGFIVEATIENHEALAKLNPDSLNTMRVMTVKTCDGKWHILKSFLKIGRRGQRVDNMSAGGLFADIDKHGVTRVGYCKFDDSEYDHHPDTGANITGFQIPYYEDTLDLAIHASKTLGFMSTFGWDIGVTPDGPQLIEANPSWHFEAIQQRLGPLLTPEIAAGLAPHEWYTPWDKTRMYPKYINHYSGGWWQRMVTASRRRRNKRLRDSI